MTSGRWFYGEVSRVVSRSFYFSLCPLQNIKNPDGYKGWKSNHVKIIVKLKFNLISFSNLIN